ncbi:carbohydrate porin [Leptolyngbya sp. FACHB-36]|uniref:iron uptake porin n=1 Tax=Leptolyngbya sp. FACHB-36 TaxID=2692808 RepID=UPI0016812221|nr:iron uptake porin [Leptolyngbya sp. FACHB-36]MBD2020058.1 carbohydrate porin [Leptolyngbya sp. FACHB-36]
MRGVIDRCVGFLPCVFLQGLLTQAAMVQPSLPPPAPEMAPLEADVMPQVTSVTQLSDVEPTDWAFQALRSLVERYGCIVGYPDRTFRGNRALTRYEFAAGLNACIDRVNELIAAATADLVKKEDLATLQRLQEEFAAELATLRGRVDALEARAATLERQQFSTTTKLNGEAIFALGATVGDQISDLNSDRTVFQNRVRLDLQTSFSGRDVLHTRLTAGNFLPPVTPGSLFPIVEQGTAEGRLSASVGGVTDNRVRLDRLDYTVPIGDRLKLYAAAAGGRSSYYVPSTVNPFFEDFDGGRGAISAFAQQNPIYRIGGGAGVGVSVGLDRGDRIVLSAGYLAARANDPSEGRGVFNGDFAALAQLTITPNPALQIGLTYVRGYHTPGNSIFALDFQNEFFAGSVPANALHTGLGVSAVTNSFGGELSFRLSPKFTLNAFGGYTDLTLLNNTGDGEVWYYGVGLAFPDLLKKGSLGGILVGVEPYLGGVTANGLRLPALGITNDTSLHVEAFYRYTLTDQIAITPGVVWVTAPDQFTGNDDYVVWTLRTTFSF